MKNIILAVTLVASTFAYAEPIEPKLSNDYVFGGSAVWSVEVGLRERISITYQAPKCENDSYVSRKSPLDTPLASGMEKINPYCHGSFLMAKVGSQSRIASHMNKCEISKVKGSESTLVSLIDTDYDQPIKIHYKCVGRSDGYQPKTVRGFAFLDTKAVKELHEYKIRSYNQSVKKFNDEIDQVKTFKAVLFIAFLTSVSFAFKLIILPLKRKAQATIASIKAKKDAGSYKSSITKMKDRVKAKSDAVTYEKEMIRERARLAVQREEAEKDD